MEHLPFNSHCFKVLHGDRFNPHNKPKIGITIIPFIQMQKRSQNKVTDPRSQI